MPASCNYVPAKRLRDPSDLDLLPPLARPVKAAKTAEKKRTAPPALAPHAPPARRRAIDIIIGKYISLVLYRPRRTRRTAPRGLCCAVSLRAQGVGQAPGLRDVQ